MERVVLPRPVSTLERDPGGETQRSWRRDTERLRQSERHGEWKSGVEGERERGKHDTGSTPRHAAPRPAHLVARVVHHQIHHQLHAPLMARVAQVIPILQGAVPRVDLLIAGEGSERFGLEHGAMQPRKATLAVARFYSSIRMGRRIEVSPRTEERGGRSEERGAGPSRPHNAEEGQRIEEFSTHLDISYPISAWGLS
jgi:hypothetical protein